MRLRMSKVQAPGDAPVTMLELFFDLVFVFVITQLTTLITGSDGWVGYGRAALVLAVTYWMYNGFAWLANNVAPTSTASGVATGGGCGGGFRTCGVGRDDRQAAGEQIHHQIRPPRVHPAGVVLTEPAGQRGQPAETGLRIRGGEIRPQGGHTVLGRDQSDPPLGTGMAVPFVPAIGIDGEHRPFQRRFELGEGLLGGAG